MPKIPQLFRLCYTVFIKSQGGSHMYGVRFYQDTIQVQEGNKVDLEAQGYEAFETKEEAETRGVNLEYRALRREFNAMTLAELDSERAKELERRIWGRYANYDGCDYVPGDNIKRRKKALQ